MTAEIPVSQLKHLPQIGEVCFASLGEDRQDAQPVSLVDDLVEAEHEPARWRISGQPVVFLLSHVARFSRSQATIPASTVIKARIR